jgi:putative oxidoreductase
MKPFFPSKLAEIIFALMIGYFGYNHFKIPNLIAGGVPSFMPGDPKIWAYVVGGCLVLAAIAIIIDYQKTLACYLLAALLLIFVFTIHIKHFSTDPSGVLKDTCMAMCAILIGNRRSK